MGSTASNIPSDLNTSGSHPHLRESADELSKAGGHALNAGAALVEGAKDSLATADQKAGQAANTLRSKTASAYEGASTRATQVKNAAASGLSTASDSFSRNIYTPVANVSKGIYSRTTDAMGSAYQSVATNLRGPVTPRLSSTGATPLATINNARGVTFLGRHTVGLNKLIMLASAGVLAASIVAPAVGAGVLALSVWHIASLGLGLTAVDFLMSRLTHPSVAGYETAKSQETAKALVDLHDATAVKLASDAKTKAYQEARTKLDSDEEAHLADAADKLAAVEAAKADHASAQTASAEELASFSQAQLADATKNLRGTAVVNATATAQVSDQGVSAAGRADDASATHL